MDRDYIRRRDFEEQMHLSSAFEEKKRPPFHLLGRIGGAIILVGLVFFIILQIPEPTNQPAIPPVTSSNLSPEASDRLLPSVIPTTTNPDLVGEWVNEWDFTHRVIKNADGTLLVYSSGVLIYSNQWKANDIYYKEIFDGGDSTATFYLSNDGNVLTMSPEQIPSRFYRALPYEGHPLIGSWQADYWKYHLNPDGFGMFHGSSDFEVKWFVFAGNRLAVYFFDENGEFLEWWDYYYELYENNLTLTNRVGDQTFYLILVTDEDAQLYT